MSSYELALHNIFEAGRFKLSTLKPSEWAEQNRIMTSDVSPIPGKFSYENSPYTRDIVDCFAPDNPARIIAVKKGAQIGFTTSVIEPAIGWIISQNPGNILYLVGHDDLVDESVEKIDKLIDSCGIRKLIKPNVNRRKNMKTGDTNRKKEFPGGQLIAGTPNNHKVLRNRSMQFGFVDDWEAAKTSTTQAGSTRKMIEQRFAAYAKKMKLAYISTPEVEQTSNIEPVYLLGDQRKYHIPCPCCNEYIALEWEIQSEKNPNNKAGITWQLDDNNELIPDSVGYLCQKCEGFFDDKNKNELIKRGKWIATAKPSEEGFVSFHISALYAPTFMYGWVKYVRDYMEACPQGQPRDEEKYKAFVNLVLGLTYKAESESLKGTELQNNNTRPYEVGVIPQKLSDRDGNGRIILLTAAADLNGLENDARLDYEIVGWSASGCQYSITHGSIGTFYPGATKVNDTERIKWTYKRHVPYSVWDEFEKVLSSDYFSDDGKPMKVFITGIDTGHYTHHAYPFIDNTNSFVVGLKGLRKEKHTTINKDEKSFKISTEKKNLYLINHNHIKEKLSESMKLKWNEGYDKVQPYGYLNFPSPSQQKYLFKNYYSHWEAEHRVIKESKDGTPAAIIWEKKNSAVQNHFWDVRVYNIAVKDIFIYLFGAESKIKNCDWFDYANAITAHFKK